MGGLRVHPSRGPVTQGSRVRGLVFDVGDTVVSPQHGAGKVERKERKSVLGEEREYLTIRILHSDMTLMVPADAAGEAGLRKVMDDAMLDRLVDVLTGDADET